MSVNDENDELLTHELDPRQTACGNANGCKTVESQQYRIVYTGLSCLCPNYHHFVNDSTQYTDHEKTK